MIGPAKWLLTNYEDEGSNRCLCLACKNYLTSSDNEMRGVPWLDGRKWKYCPWCGIEWTGEHIQSDKSKRRKDLLREANNRFYNEKQKDYVKWQIQRRMVWGNDPPMEWYDSGYWVHDSKDVVRVYKSLIETESDMDEYRVVRLYPDGTVKQVLGPEKGQGWGKCGGCGTRYRIGWMKPETDKCPRCGRME